LLQAATKLIATCAYKSPANGQYDLQNTISRAFETMPDDTPRAELTNSLGFGRHRVHTHCVHLLRKETTMTLCPIAIAVGCQKCPAFSVCPLKNVIGDAPPKDAKPAAAPSAPSKKSK
jgi:hypothetical protein